MASMDKVVLLGASSFDTPEDAQKWLMDKSKMRLSGLNERDAEGLITRLRCIATLHAHLVEDVLAMLFDLKLSGESIFASVHKRVTYEICLRQYVQNPVAVAPELILNALEELDEDDEDRTARLTRRVEAKLEKSYPYLYSLHLRRQKRALFQRRVTDSTRMQVNMLLARQFEELERTTGVQFLRGGKLNFEASISCEQLPAAFLEHAALEDVSGNPGVAVNRLDMAYRTMRARSPDEWMDYLVHLRRVLQLSLLSQLGRSEEAEGYHRPALLHVEKELNRLNDGHAGASPLASRIERLSSMHDVSDVAGAPIL